jgi:6-pyruvoyl-tetrahydropterin synthase
MLPSSLSFELFLRFDLNAAHSLHVREEAHFHLWRIEATLSGKPLEDGMIVNLPSVREEFEKKISPLEGVLLNSHGSLPESVRLFPTCETLSAHLASEFSATIDSIFRPLNPTLALDSVAITIFEPAQGGKPAYEWGGARVKLRSRP